MKSVHIAGAAIGVTIATLGGMAAFTPTADRVVGASYDRAFNLRAADQITPLAVASDRGGSEHYWLTHGTSGSNLNLTPAVADRATDKPPLADIKSAIMAGGSAAGSEQIEIVSVDPIARAAIGVEVGSAKSFLVTARIDGSARQPARLVTIVIDVAAGAAGHKARSL